MQKAFFLTMFNMGIMFILMWGLDLKINISKSFPLGVYQRVDAEIEKDTIVESCLPESVSSFMVDRGYIPDGGSCGGYPPVIKQVYGLAGDVVEVDQSVSINGVLIDNTIVNQYDERRNILTAAKSTVIEENNVWLMSAQSPKSFDARYFGQIPLSHVQSALKPLWTVR